MPIDNFGRDIKISPPSEREISSGVGVAPKRDLGRSEETVVQNLISKVQDVRAKAADLNTAIDSISASLYIPVDPLSLEVREAVGILDPSSLGGSRISYPLYVRLLRGAYERMDNVNVTRFMEALESSSVGLNRAWKNELKSVQEQADSPWYGGLLVDLAVHFGIIFGLNTMLGLADAPDKASSTSIPNAGAIALQAALGLLAMTLAHNADDILLQDSPSGVGKELNKATLSKFFQSGDPSVELLKSALNSTGLEHGFDFDSLAKDKPGPVLPAESYERLALDYASNYLGSVNDPSYVAWSLSRYSIDTEFRMGLFEGTLDNSHYSSTMGGYLESFGERAITLPKLVTAAASLPVDLVRMFACETTDAAARLDAIAEVITSQYSKDIYCCLVRFLGRVGSDWEQGLAKASALLKIGRNLTRINLTEFTSILDQVNDYLEMRIKSLLSQMVNHVMDEISDPLADFMLNLEPDIAILARCTGIMDLLNFLRVGLDMVRQMLIQTLDSLWTNIEFQRTRQEWIVQDQATRKWLGSLINIVDAVREAIDAGNLCAEGEQRYPDIDEATRFIDQRFGSVGNNLNLPSGENPYRDFFPAGVRDSLTSGLLPTPAKDANIRLLDGTSQAGCAKLLTDEELSVVSTYQAEIDQELINVQQRFRDLFPPVAVGASQ